MTWAFSSWQQWSSDETRERSDWQPSADWSSSDQTRERSEWQNEHLIYEDIDKVLPLLIVLTTASLTSIQNAQQSLEFRRTCVCDKVIHA